MYKLLICFLLLLGGVQASSQTPYPTPYTNTGSKTTAQRALGGYFFDSTVVLPSYPSLAAATASKTSLYAGSEIRVGDVRYYRNSTNTVWLPYGGGGGSTCVNGLQNGGVVTLDSLYVFDVSSAAYGINNVCYTSGQGSITLNPSDPTFDRYDVIGLDVNGNIIKVTGVPSATPAIPQVNPNTQLYLTAISVKAGSTSPQGVSSLLIYNENVVPPEWVGSTSGTANFSSTLTPYLGIICTNVGSFTDRKLTYSGAVNLNANNFNTIKFFVRLKSAFATNTDIVMRLLDGAGNEVATSPPLSSIYGFSKSTINTYQNVSVPFTSLIFNGAATTFSKLDFALLGTNTDGFFLDYITLQSGISNGSGDGNFVQNVYRRTATDSLFQTKNGVDYFVSLIDTAAGATGFIPITGTDGTSGPVTGDVEIGSGDLRLFHANSDDDYHESLFFGEGHIDLTLENLARTEYTRIGVANGAVTIGSTSPTSRGLTGAQDFTPNITDYDYPQKIYVTRVADSLKAQIAGATGVTAVTANAPISSSGGTTPIISADTSTAVTGLATKGNIATVTAIANSKYDKIGGDLTGTAGVGYLGLPAQTSQPSTPATGLLKIYSDATGRLTWLSNLGFTRTFRSAVLTANRAYNLQDKSYTIADSADVALKQNLVTLTTTGTSGAATFNQGTGALNIPNYASAGGTTSYQIQIATGSTAFTFTSVPASYSDYTVYRNGVLNNSTYDFTTSGNIITFTSVDAGDVIVFQRIK